jgi:hypothetical protein
MRKLFVVALILVAGFVSQVYGQGVQQPAWKVVGAGNFVCSKWLAARDEKNVPRQYPVIQWVAGWVVSYNYYLTGIPASQKRRVEQPDAEAISVYLDKYCKEHPSRIVAFAAAELVEQLGGEKAFHNRSARK